MMSLPTIVTCFPIADHQVQKITQSIEGRYQLLVSDQDNIANDLHEATFFCGHAKVPVDWARVVDAGKLKWIQSSAAGLDHCLTPEVIDSQIVVSGCSGLFANQVGEQTLALLMGLIRRSSVFFRAQEIKEYVRRPTDNLEGKKVLIVGFGGNGQRIARILRPMVDDIEATDCFPAACQSLIENDIVNQVYSPEQLTERLPEADVVILTLPLSDANEQLISDTELRLMRAGTYLINVGRGSVVDTPALIESLHCGHLGGAGIDVVDPEPLPSNSPLWEMDHVMISPHVGAQSPLRVPKTIDLFCQNIDRFESGQSLLNQVDKKLGFPLPDHRIQF